MQSFDFANWALGVVAVLIGAGVIGLWRLSYMVAQLQVTVSNWTKVFEDRFVVATDISREHEKRIGVAEKNVAVHQIIIDRFLPGKEGDE